MKIHQQYILTPALILFTVISAFSQTFKKTYESLSPNDKYSNMLTLREYQGQHPYEGTTYFLLGEIHEQYVYETNPLKLFYWIESNRQQARTYYGLVKLRLDEKQAKQNREYFGEIPIKSDKKKIGFEDIITEVDKRLKAIDDYYKKTEQAHNSYINCINSYNNCLFTFREIHALYPNKKTLYLLTTNDIKNKVDYIHQQFDSVLYNFEIYKQACTQLTHVIKVPNYQLLPISTYRLEGLVESDFTQAEVNLWDYKTWANDFKKVLLEEIKPIRENIVKTDKLLDKQISALQHTAFYTDDFNITYPDPVFMNQIGKYDYSSLCNQLFSYKKEKIDFLKQLYHPVLNINDLSNVYLINQLRHFKNIAIDLKALNKSALLTKESATMDAVGNYIHFFNDNYNGMDGLIRWCEVERYTNYSIFSEHLSILNQFIQKEKNKYHVTDSCLKITKNNLVLGIQQLPTDTVITDTSYTTHFIPLNESVFLIAGFNVLENSSTMPYVAYSDTIKNIFWQKKPILPKLSKNETLELTTIQVINDTTYVALYHQTSSIDSNTIIRNYVIHYNEKGSEIFSELIDSTGLPQSFWYDDINDDYFLITTSKDKDSLSRTTANIILANKNCNAYWEQSIQFDGNIVNYIHTNGDFILTLNCKQLKIKESEYFKTTDSKIAFIYLSRNGSIKVVKYFENKNQIPISSAYKINSNLINLVGTQNNQSNYMLIDPNGDMVFSNQDLH